MDDSSFERVERALLAFFPFPAVPGADCCTTSLPGPSGRPQQHSEAPFLSPCSPSRLCEPTTAIWAEAAAPQSENGDSEYRAASSASAALRLGVLPLLQDLQ